MENNTKALTLYQNLGYRNLLYSQIRFKITSIPTEIKSKGTIKLEPISAEKAQICRDQHLLTLVEMVSGHDGREIVQRLYLDRLKGDIDSFRILASNKEVGYVSLKRRKDTVSVFLILDKDLWGTTTELQIAGATFERASRSSKSRIEYSVLQAYEESLGFCFRKLNVKYDRTVPRLGLAKRIDAS